MSIVKRPQNKSVDEFIQSAPDAHDSEKSRPASNKGIPMGKQAQISFAMPPELLSRVDEAAHKLSISRAAFMKMAITRAVDAEIV